MRILMIGYGKMGQEICERHLAAGGTALAIDPRYVLQTGTSSRIHSSVQCVSSFVDIGSDPFDVAIDFSTPTALRANVETLLEKKIPIVIGTTGWQADEKAIADLVVEQSGTAVFSSNYSLGVQLYLQVLRQAARRISLFEDFDVAGFERHHRQKTDSPSGTALSIAQVLQEEFSTKPDLLTQPSEGKIATTSLHFPSQRVGFFPGTHEVVFDSPSESLHLEMISRNRDGFSTGALWAAQWIAGQRDDASKPEPGWYEFSDVVDEFVSEQLAIK